MADLPESSVYEEGIYQLETTDPVIGGVDGIDNIQAKQLANRTKWLKQVMDTVITEKGLTVDNDDLTQLLQAVDVNTPAGHASLWFDEIPPTGYLEADGSAVSRVAFADLFAIYGTRFGVGDGTTTFNLPDARGEALRGWDNGRGVDAGRALGSWQNGSYMPGDNASSDEIIYIWDSSDPGLNWDPATQTLSSGTSRFVTVSGNLNPSIPAHGGTARMRNIATMVIIKY